MRWEEQKSFWHPQKRWTEAKGRDANESQIFNYSQVVTLLSQFNADAK